MRTLLIILFAILILINTSAIPITRGIDYNHSARDIITSLKDNIVQEYNKNFERNIPENKQLYHLFILHKSFNSTIVYTDYGMLAVFFQESNHPNANSTIIHLPNQDQPINLFGTVFSKYIYMNDLRLYNIKGYRYGYETNIYDLSSNFSNISIDLANDFFDLDNQRYYETKGRLEQIEASKLEELNKTGEEFIRAYQSGDVIAKANAKNRFFQLAERLGIAEPNANRDFATRINQTSEPSFTVVKNFLLTNFLFGILTPIYLIILSISIIRFINYKNRSGNQESVFVEYIQVIGAFVLGPIIFLIILPPNDITSSKLYYVLFWVLFLIAAIYKKKLIKSTYKGYKG